MGASVAFEYEQACNFDVLSCWTEVGVLLLAGQFYSLSVFQCVFGK